MRFPQNGRTDAAPRHVRRAVAVVVLRVVPDDAADAARHHGHADDGAYCTVGGGDGHLQIRSDEEPDRDGQDDAGHAVHQ